MGHRSGSPPPIASPAARAPGFSLFPIPPCPHCLSLMLDPKEMDTADTHSITASLNLHHAEGRPEAPMPKGAWSFALPFCIALRLGSSFLLTNMYTTVLRNFLTRPHIHPLYVHS